LSAAFRDLSRSTASGDIAGFAAGRGVDEDLWNPDPESQHGLEKLAQPPSHAQLEAARFSYWLLSDHDQGAVLEVLEGHPIPVPVYASSVDDSVRLYFRLSPRHVSV